MCVVRQAIDQRVSDQLQQVEGRMQRPQAVAASLAGHQQQVCTTLVCTKTHKQRLHLQKSSGSPGQRGAGARLTQRDSRCEHRGGQRSGRSSVNSTGTVDEAREALQDARSRADVVDPHEAASCERDAPRLLQVQHLQRRTGGSTPAHMVQR